MARRWKLVLVVSVLGLMTGCMPARKKAPLYWREVLRDKSGFFNQMVTISGIATNVRADPSAPAGVGRYVLRDDLGGRVPVASNKLPANGAEVSVTGRVCRCFPDSFDLGLREENRQPRSTRGSRGLLFVIMWGLGTLAAVAVIAGLGIVAFRSLRASATSTRRVMPIVQRPVLRVEEGPDQGRIFPLAGDRINVGRSSNRAHGLHDIILRDPYVSRVHAILQREGKVWTLSNQSRHGTQVNSRQVSSAHLKAGDRIRLQRTVLLLVSAGDSELHSEWRDHHRTAHA